MGRNAMYGIVKGSGGENAMKAWRGVALLASFLLGAFMLLEALALGSFSIQWIAAYALAVGAFTLWGFTVAAGYAAYRGRPMRPWIVRSGVTVAASLIVAVVVWGPTDASFRRHHRSQVVPLLPTLRGIIPTNRGPFSAQDFMVSNGYIGQLGNNVVTAYAGVNPGTSGGPTGGVRVYARPADAASTSSDTYIGEFLSPTGPYFLAIVSVDGARVTLSYQGSHTVVFDLNNDTFQ